MTISDPRNTDDKSISPVSEDAPPTPSKVAVSSKELVEMISGWVVIVAIVGSLVAVLAGTKPDVAFAVFFLVLAITCITAWVIGKCVKGPNEGAQLPKSGCVMNSPWLMGVALGIATWRHRTEVKRLENELKVERSRQITTDSLFQPTIRPNDDSARITIRAEAAHRYWKHAVMRLLGGGTEQATGTFKADGSIEVFVFQVEADIRLVRQMNTANVDHDLINVARDLAAAHEQIANWLKQNEPLISYLQKQHNLPNDPDDPGRLSWLLNLPTEQAPAPLAELRRLCDNLEQRLKAAYEMQIRLSERFPGKDFPLPEIEN